MGISVLVEGGGGTTSEALQEQSVVVSAPSVGVDFAEDAPLAVQVQGGGIAVAILAPGYSEQVVGAQYLNDLLDVEATPSGDSLLQYDESQGQWTAGPRMRFRPGLKCFVVTDPA